MQDSFMYKWQQVHIFDELLQNNIEVTVFNPLKITPVECISKLKDLIRANEFDIFMTCHGDAIIKEEIVPVFNKLGIPTLLICFDNLHAPYLHKQIAKYFDLVWLTSRETMPLFKRWGCKNVTFQPYAANPYLFKPKTIQRVALNEVSFIGTPYGTRVNKINKLTYNNIPVSVYSDSINKNALSKSEVLESWASSSNLLEKVSTLASYKEGRKVLLSAFINRFLGKEDNLLENDSLKVCPSVSFDEMVNIYTNSSLSLNILELRNTYVLSKPVYKLHLRTFEVPMAGGLQFTSYFPELSEYFEEEKEIVMYKSEEEYLDKARFYIDSKNNNLVKSMKERARFRAVNEHTWTNRFDKIFENLGLSRK